MANFRPLIVATLGEEWCDSLIKARKLRIKKPAPHPFRLGMDSNGLKGRFNREVIINGKID